MNKNYRNGGIGALLDLYEQELSKLENTIKSIPDAELLKIISPDSTNGCDTFQGILSHVVHSGFGYATSIYNSAGNAIVRPEKTFRLTIAAYLDDLKEVFNYTAKILSNFRDEDLEQLDPSEKIITNWGQLYDIEQLMEHAIVHIMRHDRQLEKLKSQFHV
jgi:hypothetical protein